MKILKDHAREYLKLVSQVLFFNNASFGLALLVLIAAFDPYSFACAFFVSLVGYVYPLKYGAPRTLTSYGLFVINGFFFGLAMAYMFEPSLVFGVFLVFGALALPKITKALHEVLQHWKLSPFVAPYIFCAWLVWLCKEGAGIEQAAQRATLTFAPLHSFGWASESLSRIIETPFLSMGRLLFIPSAGFGVLLLALITMYSLRKGFFFLLGISVAVAVSMLIARGTEAWSEGVLTYSAGLVALGLASYPEKFSWRTISFYCALSALISLATVAFLDRIGLTTLSTPFLVTMWMASLSQVPRVNVSWAPDKMRRTPMIGSYEPINKKHLVVS